jgi:hypothetical protein
MGSHYTKSARRLLAGLCLATLAVACSSSGDKNKDFTNRPGANSPATAGTAPTSSTGTNDQGNTGK